MKKLEQFAPDSSFHIRVEKNKESSKMTVGIGLLASIYFFIKKKASATD